MAMDAPRSFDRPEESDRTPNRQSASNDPQARLAALAAHLTAHRYKVELTGRGLHVVNPQATGCCAESPVRADLITCHRRASDGGRLWYVTSWQQPIAEADRITDAITMIKSYLGAP